MILESLPIKTYEENGKSFVRCEGSWRTLQDTPESYLKQLFDNTRDVIRLMYQEADVAIYEWNNVIKLLNSGKVVKAANLYFRVKNNLPKCVICGCSYEKRELTLNGEGMEEGTCPECLFPE